MTNIRRHRLSVREQFTESALSCCTHFTGTMHERCKAGITYAAIDHPLPCYRDGASGEWRGTCHLRRIPTLEEAQAQAAERGRNFELGNEGSRRAYEASKGIRGGNGVVECPKCGGRLHWSKARSNGHIWGKCETPGCLTWMQ